MSDKKVNGWQEFLKGIWKENPVFIVVLGLCPTLAVTTQTINGLAMGVAVIFVLALANLFVSLLRNFIPSSVRIPAYILVIASFVTLVQMSLQAFAPDINKALGIFIPLIVVNCVILGRAEAFAAHHKPGHAVLDGLGMGIGFTIALTLIAAIREMLGNGSIDLRFAGMGVMFNFSEPIQGDPSVINVFVNMVKASGEMLLPHGIVRHPAVAMILPPGGFLVMGVLLGLFQHKQNKKEDLAKELKKKAADAAKAKAAAAKPAAAKA